MTTSREPLNWQQLIAAYADGELDDATHNRFQNWLAEHPDLYDRLEAQRLLSPANIAFWSAVDPPRPSPEEWASVWNRISASLDAPQPMPQRAPWWRRGLMAAVLAVPSMTAAAALVIALVSHNTVPPAVAPTYEASDEEIFAIACDDDVQILSVRDRDTERLVVGQPLLNADMPLAEAGDVRLDGVVPAGDGLIAEVHMGWNEVPMVFVSTPRAP